MDRFSEKYRKLKIATKYIEFGLAFTSGFVYLPYSQSAISTIQLGSLLLNQAFRKMSLKRIIDKIDDSEKELPHVRIYKLCQALCELRNQPNPILVASIFFKLDESFGHAGNPKARRSFMESSVCIWQDILKVNPRDANAIFGEMNSRIALASTLQMSLRERKWWLDPVDIATNEKSSLLSKYVEADPTPFGYSRCAAIKARVAMARFSYWNTLSQMERIELSFRAEREFIEALRFTEEPEHIAYSLASNLRYRTFRLLRLNEKEAGKQQLIRLRSLSDGFIKRDSSNFNYRRLAAHERWLHAYISASEGRFRQAKIELGISLEHLDAIAPVIRFSMLRTDRDSLHRAIREVESQRTPILR